MLIVTGYVHVDPANVVDFIADFKSLELSTRMRAGNLSYSAALDDAEAGRFLVAERWADQAALTAHLQADDTVAFVTRWKGLLRGDIHKYDASNERNLDDN